MSEGKMKWRKSAVRAFRWLIFDTSGASQAVFFLLVFGLLVIYINLLPEQMARELSYFLKLVRFF